MINIKLFFILEIVEINTNDENIIIIIIINYNITYLKYQLKKSIIFICNFIRNKMQFEVVDGDGTPNLQIYTNYKYTWLFRDSCVFTREI